ncbi:hypothetical protein Glove_12g50 [Diversispora epigaea]|uniref:Uncharacterized protein n=1 Tax=Diversispora epigaea TaxID=1348612 RepID=A0A397JZ28_9GLOM|nr:hypothetical protein Glove_12g50 [Diversispora epigaea]
MSLSSVRLVTQVRRQGLKERLETLRTSKVSFHRERLDTINYRKKTSRYAILSGSSGVVEFWKKLPNAKIAFPIPQDIEEAELNGLKSYSTIENSYICLNKGVITDSNGMLYNNGEITNIRLPSKLVDNFGGILCLSDVSEMSTNMDQNFSYEIAIYNCLS